MTQSRDPLGTGPMNDPDPHNADSGCPPVSVWSEVVAGSIPEEVAMAYLSHTAVCQRCSDLLAKDLPPDVSDATPEEEAILLRLKTATTEGQRRLAAVMFQAAEAGRKPRRGKLLRWPVLALAAAAAVALAAYVTIPYLRPPSDEQLLAKAYDRNRLSELRIPGSASVSLASPTRGSGSTPVTSTELLKVKLSAQQRFEQTPNDPALRQTLGEIAIVERDGETARREFEMAEALNPNLPRLKLDMASAYFELAETKQHPLDYARAIDFYGQYLQEVHGQDPVALFDRGLCWERQSVNSEAIKDFEAALALEKNAAWRKEIQRHIDKLKAQSALDDDATPYTPATLLALKTESPGDYENYLDVAGREWLTHRNEPQTAAALKKLAAMGAEKHGDLWLRDFLAGPVSAAGDAALSRSIQSNANGLYDAAKADSESAKSLYEQVANQPGAISASAEYVHALQRSAKTGQCISEAAKIESGAAIERYSRLAVYTQLELAACNAMEGNIAVGLKNSKSAIVSASQSNLPVSGLRATGFAVDYQIRQEHYHSAWGTAVDSLKDSATVSKVDRRRYQLFDDLEKASGTLDLPWTEVALAEAAVQSADKIGSAPIAAYALESLGVDQLRVGDASAAMQAFAAADRKLAESSDKASVSLYRADWTADRAALVERQRGAAEAASLLSSEEARFEHIEAFYPKLHFFTELAKLLREAHLPAQSMQKAWAIIGDSERILRTLRTEEQRHSLHQETSHAYQILILDMADSNQSEAALRTWEWFRSAPYRHAPDPAIPADSSSLLATLPRIESPPPGTLILVFARLEDSYIAWSVSPGQPISMRILTIKAAQITAEGEALLRLCSDPKSSKSDINLLGGTLYRQLLLPFQDQIARAPMLALDLDPSLSDIPFAVLASDGRFLGVDHQLLFLPNGLGHPSAAPDASLDGALSGSPRLIVLKETPRTAAARIPAEYDESFDIPKAFPQAQVEQATLFRSGAGLNLVGQPALRRAIATADLLHYSGHGLDEDQAPNVDSSSSQSKLGLSRGSMPRCRLAVLAACHSIREREDSAEDVPSFARILLRAGAGHVLATQWDVDSRMTHELMVRLYAELAGHQTFTEALRRAQQSLQMDGETSHPYYWSAFQMIGQ